MSGLVPWLRCRQTGGSTGRVAAGADRLLRLELRRLAGAFYPKGLPARRWLEHYASPFDTVEVNNTFYRLPSRDAVANWAAQTPPDFVFAVKASRYLTHIKRLTTLGQGVERFYERIEPLVEAGKLGPVLWQLPANFHCDLERLRRGARAASRRPALLRVPPPELVQRRRLRGCCARRGARS